MDAEVNVTYIISEYAQVSMTETHLYVGTDILPTNKGGKSTVSPGKYPYKEEYEDGQTRVEYIIEDYVGDFIYVVAHATVCEDLE